MESKNLFNKTNSYDVKHSMAENQNRANIKTWILRNFLNIEELKIQKVFTIFEAATQSFMQRNIHIQVRIV